MTAISKLHYITTNAALAEHACKGGVDWVQLRLKDVSYDEYRTVALEVQKVCKKYGATFIVNDNIELALDINADGVHIGKEDALPQELAERMLKKGGIIGRTTNTIEDIANLQGQPVSYIGLGPFRFTQTKKKLSPILGLSGYSKLLADLKERGISHPPIIGIGGITQADVTELLSTGLHGIAVSGAISNAADASAVAKQFKDSFTYEYQ